MFKRKPGPSAFVGGNIELGRVISFHKAAGLEIVFFRQDVLSRIIVYIKAVLKKKMYISISSSELILISLKKEKIFIGLCINI